MLNRDLLYKTAENMGVKIDDDAFNRFDIYAELLFETNKKFNLTAITEPDDMTVKHFAFPYLNMSISKREQGLLTSARGQAFRDLCCSLQDQTLT